ncbi:hypothetical protein C0J52_08980 [Blattella germanica]|nr:hypothetical protein C0J52_08980 [Blattella germanica]
MKKKMKPRSINNNEQIQADRSSRQQNKNISFDLNSQHCYNKKMESRLSFEQRKAILKWYFRTENVVEVHRTHLQTLLEQ